MNDHIHFVVSRIDDSNICKENNAARLIQALEDALLDSWNKVQEPVFEAKPDLKQ